MIFEAIDSITMAAFTAEGMLALILLGTIIYVAVQNRKDRKRAYMSAPPVSRILFEPEQEQEDEDDVERVGTDDFDEFEAEEGFEEEPPSDEQSVVITVDDDSVDEAYYKMSREQKERFDRLKAIALSREGAVYCKTPRFAAVKMGRRCVVKMRIKRGNVVAQFGLENELLKQYKKKKGTKDKNSKIKVKPVTVLVSDTPSFQAAADMIELVYNQIKGGKGQETNRA